MYAGLSLGAAGRFQECFEFLKFTMTEFKVGVAHLKLCILMEFKSQKDVHDYAKREYPNFMVNVAAAEDKAGRCVVNRLLILSCLTAARMPFIY